MKKSPNANSSKITKISRAGTLEISGIEKLILNIRGQQVMLDRDLAKLYGVETRTLNQAVKRNAERFPEHYCFPLSKEEFANWRSQIVISNSDKIGLRYVPYAFTEHGIAMLSAVLRSAIAVQVSVQIIDAFVAMRRFLANNGQILQRLDRIELKQLESDEKFRQIFNKFEEQNSVLASEKIFFDGQIFDAYKFVCNLVKSAKREIFLIDNYVDESILTLLDKRKKGVPATIFTERISEQLRLDLAKHDAQYPAVPVKIYKRSHDRFLCIDDTVYHFGASLKDLGKKWFAVAILNDIVPADLLARINGEK